MPTISLSDYGDELFDAGFPGMDADINISSIVNYVNGAAVTEIGVAVGVDVNGVLMAPATGNVVGVTMHHVTYVADQAGDFKYPPHSAVPVMEFGRVWAICVAGCNVGDPVGCAPDGKLSVGGPIVVDGAFWDDKAAAGGIARVRLNRVKLPAGAVSEGAGRSDAEEDGRFADELERRAPFPDEPSGPKPVKRPGARPDNSLPPVQRPETRPETRPSDEPGGVLTGGLTDDKPGEKPVKRP